MTRLRLYLGPVVLIVAALASGDLYGGSQVRIYQLDGSSQCQADGVPLAEMQRTLERLGIRVFSARKDFAPITVLRACGQPSAQANTYRVSAADWRAACQAATANAPAPPMIRRRSRS